MNYLNFIFNVKKYNFFVFKVFFFGSYFIRERKINFSSQFDSSKKIAIYGFGPYGEKSFLKLFARNKIVCIYDKKFYEKPLNIKSPEKLGNEDFDFIIITVMDKTARKNVLDFLLSKGVSNNNILYADFIE